MTAIEMTTLWSSVARSRPCGPATLEKAKFGNGDHVMKTSRFLDEERDVFEKAKTWTAGGAPGQRYRFPGQRYRFGTKSKGTVVAEIFKGKGTKVC